MEGSLLGTEDNLVNKTQVVSDLRFFQSLMIFVYFKLYNEYY